MSLRSLLNWLFCCGAPSTKGAKGAVANDLEESCNAAAQADAIILLAAPLKKATKEGEPIAIPEAIQKQYARVIPHDVAIEGQGVCLTSDVAVLGNVVIKAGGTCITGNVLVVGDVEIDGKDDTTINGVCVTGDVIVLGDVTVRGHVCVTHNVFVKGNIRIQGSLKTQRKLCYWGYKDIQPLPPTPPSHAA